MMKIPAFTPRSFSEVGRVLLFTLILFIFTLSPSYASSPSPSTLSPIPSSNLHNYTQQVVLDLSSALTCQLVGIDPTGPDPVTGQPKKCLGYDVSGKLGFVPNPAPNGAGQVGGAVGTMGNLIAVLYTPPASTGDYFRYLANNFGIVKPAYAAEKCDPTKIGVGIGFCGLSPLLSVWTVFRNLAYFFFVIAFVVVGMAIMLRVKIDPRTVMTIQNQIPKLIIALLLVTFSFAIAGFLIDLMYVVIYLFFNVAGTASPALKTEIDTMASQVQGQNALEAVGGLGGIFDLTNRIASSTTEVIQSLLGIDKSFTQNFDLSDPGKIFGSASKYSGSVANWIIDMLSLSAGIGAAAKIGSMIQTPLLSVAAAVLAGPAAYLLAQESLRLFIPFGIAFIIIIIAILWALFRLWFALIMAYVYILIDVIFAPLWLLTGVLPGGLGFGSWLRDIVANLSAFPTTIGMFLIGKILMETVGKVETGTFVPPLIGNPGQGAQSLLASLIGLGIILMTPQVVNMMKEAFKAPQMKYTAAIGQAVGVGPGLGLGAFGVLSQLRLVFPNFPLFRGGWFREGLKKVSPPGGPTEGQQGG